MRRTSLSPLLTAALLLLLGVAGCGEGTPAPTPAVEYDLDPALYTTLQRTFAPRAITTEARAAIAAKELRVIDPDKFAAAGLGVEVLAGQPWVERTDLAPDFVPGAAGARRSLSWFWQASDAHMTDEESPIRFEGVYSITFGSTFRPHGHLSGQVFEAQVRSARRIAALAGRPLDFAILTGDTSDGGQRNELAMAVAIMNGGEVDPDSARNDDPAPGPGNDASDPFLSAGVGVPWYVVVGNHEVNYSGSFETTPEVQEAAVGNAVFDWFEIAWGLPGTEGLSNGCRLPADPWPRLVTSGKVPADPAREILSLTATMQLFVDGGGEPAGHGFTAADAAAGIGYYSFRPVADAPLRVVVLNMLQTEPATEKGQVDEAQMAWLQQQLAAAETEGDLVIVASHHLTDWFSAESAVRPETFRATLAASPNVILHIAGHGHANLSIPIQPAGGTGNGYWELMLTSALDFPVQTRFFELVYEGNGFLSVYATNLEPNAAEGTPAQTAVDLAAAHRSFTDSDARGVWEAAREHMNLLLRLRVPAAVAARLDAASLSTVIASEETLAAL